MPRLAERPMLVASLAFVLAGFAGGRQGPDEKAAQPAASPDRARIHPSSLKACELVTVEDVARIAGGKPVTRPSATGPACMYVIDVSGGTESYNLLFERAEMFESLLKVQSSAEEGEKIAGSWDEARLKPQHLGKGVRLRAVWRGAIALEVSGRRKKPVIEIAKLAASRIP